MTRTADDYIKSYAAREAERAESDRQNRRAKIAGALGYIDQLF